ncbi:CDP-alcohol phosphatidyltransferase family protein [Litchfieldella rifensis]|uniref:CDP-alcohol phosphatidyltransferase family protein n=1 Tax=Litchfieldella rifensis TaxID=762643 RepID=A0ABV7LJ36_9GAMM
MHEPPTRPAALPWRDHVPLLLELASGLAITIATIEALRRGLAAPPGMQYGAGLIYVAMAFVILRTFPDRWLGWANRITLLRVALVAVMTGTLWFPEFLEQHATAMVVLALTILLLDGVDGWVARRTHSASAFGARFDMEIDAVFIVVLCAALLVLDKVGPWVLVIGAMRYAFIAAGWRWAWLRVELPDSRRRKVVCVWQIVTLLTCLLPDVDHSLTSLLAGLVLLLLLASFAIDVRWLATESKRTRSN